MAVVVAPAPAQAAPPSNDDFANAQVLPGLGTYTGTNVDATTEAGEPDRLVSDIPDPFNDYAPAASVWYQWTSPDVATPPTMQVSTAGSDFDSVLAVFTGPDLTHLTQVAANDDFGAASGPSRVQFAPARNTTYWIAVDGCCAGSPSMGSIQLRLSETTGDASITGFVTDGSGNGIENICVVALDSTGQQVSSQEVTTDPTGEYLLASVEAGPDRHLKFSNCGGDSSNWAGQFNGGAQTLATAANIVVTNGVGLTGVNETLVPGGSISGTVSADDAGYSGSLANICVRATMVGDPDDGFTRQTITAADGTYTINGLDGGSYEVSFAGGCGSNQDFGTEVYGTEVAVTEGSTTTAIDAGLGAAPGAIAGTVLAWSSGPALSGICVRANSSSFTSATVQTDGGGNYIINNVPAGAGYVVRFTDCNTPTNPLTTQWYNRALKQSRAASVTVNVNSTTSGIDAVMFHAATIGGRLTDENGNPRDPACVNVYKDDDITTPIDSVTTDANGDWSTQVPPGNYKLEMTDCGGGGLSFETRWYHNQTSGATADLVFVDQGEVKTNLDQVLPGTPGTDGRIEGVVTDDTVAHNPLAGICVSATSVGAPATTTTDAQGRYSFDLPADSYVVEFEECDPARPYNVFTQYWDDVTAQGDATPVVVTSGTTTSGIVARMHPAGGISGTVTHGSTPLQDICVTVYELDQTTVVASTSTDASGQYELKGLVTGSYDVSFEDCNYIYVPEWYDNQPYFGGSPDPVDVVEGATTSGIDADLDRFGTISGHVTNEAGDPLADMCVIAYSPPGIFAYSAVTDTNGDYMIGALGDPDSPTPVQYAVNIYDCANVYGDAWWNDKLDYDSADLVDVTFGQDTPNIDAVLQDTDPANTAAPVARGRAVVGVGLRASNGTWDHDPRAFTFQWYRCQADGSDCQPVSTGGDQREYVATVDDLGFRLRVDVTAQNNLGSTTAESALTDVVATASAPPNDDIEDRQDLTGALPIAVIGDNIDATRQPGEPDHLGLADGASVWYEWTAPGGVPDRVTVNLDGSSFDTTLSVYDGTPTPFSGLHLVAENDDYQSMTSTATFAPTPGTTYYIAVDGYVDPTTHEVSEGTVDLRIDAATGIAGTVTAAVGGAPVRDICVTASPDTVPSGPSIETSADGTYFLELDPGTWNVDFYDCAGQYDEQWYDGVTDPANATPVTVTRGSVSTGIDAAMVESVPFGSISGTVTNEGGSPIPDICVIALSSDSSSSGVGYTDQDGTFQVRGLGDPDNPGTALDYAVAFTDCGGFYGDEFYDNKLDPGTADPVSVTLDQDVTGIDATLQYQDPVNTAPPTITGQASVGETLTADNGTWDHEPSVFGYEWYRCDADGTSNCVPQNSGFDPTYLLTSADEGHTIRVDVTATNSIGFTTASSAPTGVVDTAPPPNDDIQNRQVLSGAVPIAVTGTNVNATRQPGEPDHLGYTHGASVWYEWTAPTGGAALDMARISLAGSNYDYTLSVYDGTPVPFSGLTLVAETSSTDVPPGEVDFAPVAGRTYYIAVDGYYDGTTVAQGTVQLAISHSRGFAGTVTNEGGDPIQGICVDAFDDFGTPLANDTTDANGDYQVVGLDPGDYKVRFSDCDLVYVDQWWDNQPDFNTANHVHVGANAITQGVDAAMARYGTISGRWTDENGDPVYDPSCGAYAYDATTGDFAGSGFTDVDGYYTIGGLQTGSYVVDFSPCTGGFGDEWWNNKLSQATATPISVTFGQDTGGIDVVLQDSAPVNTTLPSISGNTGDIGSTLTAANGQWQHDPSAYEYQWLRCDDSAGNCVPIATATGSSYVTTGDDLLARIRVEVKATNSIGSTRARSNATGVLGRPTVLTAPTVSGPSTIPGTVTATTGTWTGSPTGYEYQWLRCDDSAGNCVPIVTATGSAYVTTSDDVGRVLRVRVTATNAAGSASSISNATGVLGRPTVLTAPTVSGPSTIPGTVTATTGTWTGSPTGYEYQWLRCDDSAGNCVPIVTATGSAYVTTSDDVGRVLRVRVTATNAAGSASSISNATGVLGRPTVLTAPTVSGPSTIPGTVTATTGTWTGSPTGYEYQWLRCDDSAGNCVPIVTATGSAYVTTSDDVGRVLRVRVTATNAAGSASSISNATGVLGRPTVLTAPTVSGPSTIPGTVTATTGTWTGSPTGYEYQWLRCDDSAGNCVPIVTATGSAYVTTSDDVGRVLRVRVTATNAAGSASSISNATGVLGRPTVLTAPTVSGPSTIPGTVTATTGTWTGSPTGYEYQWLRCDDSAGNCVPIATATASTYASATSDDVGRVLRVRVTATNAAGSASSISNATGVLGRPTVLTAPTVSGPSTIPGTVTATTGTWTGSPTGYEYQWLRCDDSAGNCVPIATATGSAYVTTSDDVGRVLRVRVTATNAAGSASSISNATLRLASHEREDAGSLPSADR